MSQSKEARVKRQRVRKESDNESGDDESVESVILTDIIECEYDYIAKLWCIRRIDIAPGFYSDTSKIEAGVRRGMFQRTTPALFLDKVYVPGDTTDYTWVCTQKNRWVWR
jgi:hypothetical protein